MSSIDLHRAALTCPGKPDRRQLLARLLCPPADLNCHDQSGRLVPLVRKGLADAKNNLTKR